MIAPKVQKPSTRDEKAAYAAVAERSGGVCEGCGVRPASDMHHRKYRSRMGLTTVENLLHLCGGEGMSGGNHSGCHGDAHTLIGEQLGWSVRSFNDPAEVPVFHKTSGEWTLLDAPILPVLAMELMVAYGQIRQGMSA